MEPAKLWNIFKAKAVGRSGISQAFQEGCILLRFLTHLLDIFFHWALSACSYLGMGDTGYIPCCRDGPATQFYTRVWTLELMPGMCRAGRGPRNHLWSLGYFHPPGFSTLNTRWQQSQASRRVSSILCKEATIWNWPRAGSRPVFKSQFHCYLRCEFRRITLSPSFNFLLYKAPPSPCWEINCTCACPPLLPFT